MHIFEVQSNESACRKSGRLGLEHANMPTKLSEWNWWFYHQMELANASANATAVTGSTREDIKEGQSTGLIV